VRVPLVDLVAQHASIRAEVMAAAEAVILSQSFILGEPVERFERTLAATCGVAHAVGVASGSDALALALQVAGVRPGDRVVTTAFTFVATAEAIVRVGARPLFVDVDPRTMNLSPAHVAEALAGPLGATVRALLPVHIFGLCADMEAIGGVARDHGLAVVEDAAQAIGARARGSAGASDAIADRAAGAFGAMGCFSFFPSKNLGAWGDGGAVTTDSAEHASRLRRLRSHGAIARGVEEFDEPGTNSRLDALQAAVLDVKARHLAAWTRARAQAARRYVDLLAPVAERVTLPEPPRDGVHAYNQFVLRFEERDALKAHLEARGIASRAYYTRPLHRQACFAGRHDTHRTLRETERAAATALAIPIYPEITPEQQAYVADAIIAFVSARR
jgi:dTDP-4-amino-4,6-dideoxygalactose transaminase